MLPPDRGAEGRFDATYHDADDYDTDVD